MSTTMNPMNATFERAPFRQAGGFFEEFVDEGLVGFGLTGGHAAETRRGKTRRQKLESRRK
jgi:hypothetical protein